MRALRVLVVVMGVMIVVGTATLGVLIFRRLGADGEKLGAPRRPATVAVLLDEPPGTRITTIAGLGDRLALHLQGGGPDRVVVLDPRSGFTAARIALSR